MAFRINLLATCLAGGVISVLAAMLILVKTDSPFLAFVPTAVIPAGFCWLAGLRDQKTLFMISVFATIGWFAGTALTPVISMGPRLQLEKTMNSPLAGNGAIIPCAVLGAIFAFCRAVFAGSPQKTNSDMINERPESNNAG